MRQQRVGTLRLSIGILTIAAVWLIVLPSLGQLTSVRQRIDGNHAAGINPTAVFYTDHPAMSEIERRIEARVSAPTASFWKRNAGSASGK